MNLDSAHPILDTAYHAFVSMDLEGRISYRNPRAAEIFGYSREEAVGRELADAIIPPAYRDAHWNGLRRFLADGVGPVLGNRLTLTGLRRDGTEFPIEITISALREGDSWSFPRVCTGHLRAGRGRARARRVARPSRGTRENRCADETSQPTGVG